MINSRVVKTRSERPTIFFDIIKLHTIVALTAFHRIITTNDEDELIRIVDQTGDRSAGVRLLFIFNFQLSIEGDL